MQILVRGYFGRTMRFVLCNVFKEFSKFISIINNVVFLNTRPHSLFQIYLNTKMSLVAYIDWGIKCE